MAITPGSYNISARQGGTFSLTLSVSVGASAFNLTGYDIRGQVRVRPSSTSTILEFSTTDGRITKNNLNGTFTIVVPANVMDAIAPRTYRYDIELVSPSGDVVPLLEGRFSVSAQVTR